MKQPKRVSPTMLKNAPPQALYEIVGASGRVVSVK